MMPLIARIIGNKLISMEFRQYQAFNVVGIPQRIEGMYVDPNDGVVWRVTLQRVN